MKVAVSTHLFAFGLLTERHLALIPLAGFSRIELWGMRPHVEWGDRSQVDRFAGAVKDLGLEVGTIHLPFYTRFGAPDFLWLSFDDPNPQNRQKALDLSCRIVDLCPRFGCDMVVLHGNGGIDSDPSRSDATFRRCLDEFLPYCEQRGVRIALENIMTPLSATTVLCDLVDEYASDFLGLCLDTGHAHITGNLAQAVAAAGDRMITSHIADNRGTEDDHMVPYQGTVDWSEAFGAFHAHCPNLENFTFELMYPRMEDGSDIDVYRRILQDSYAAWQRMNRDYESP